MSAAKYVLSTVFIMLSMVCVSAAHAAKYALLIGINQYDGTSFNPLDGAANDVELMRSLLLQPRFAYQPENITVLLDNEATHSHILQSLADLTAKVHAGDEVYIHYSGHGSTACDLNGDEGKGLDSTLVSYGSRSGPEVESSGACPGQTQLVALQGATGAQEPDLDDYDVLDDELENALGKLAAQAVSVVFVADSCHSGTITRGERPMKTRGVALDARPHPRGLLPVPASGAPRGWVGIGAAGVEEKAREYKANGKDYGAYTWFWAKALEQSRPTDTWMVVFNRTKAFLRDAQVPQTPQLEGNARRRLFADGEGGAENVFMVTSVYADGKKVLVNIGSLAGITPGSVLRAGAEDKPDALLTVVTSNPTDCEAEVTQGTVATGDTVVLQTWAAEAFTLRAYLRTDRAEDAGLLDAVKKAYFPPEPANGAARPVAGTSAKLQALKLVDKPDEADMVLWVLRPGKDTLGNFVRAPGAFLPESDPKAAPELWVVDPGETGFFGGRESLRAPLTDKGLSALAENLGRMLRMRAVLDMPMPVAGEAPVNFTCRVYIPCPENEWDTIAPADRADFTAAGYGKWKFGRTLPVDGQDMNLSEQERCLIVEAENTTSEPYYVYGINITENAAITSFLPDTSRMIVTDVPPKGKRIFRDTALILTDPVEYVRFMAVKRQFDISLLEQEELQVTRSKGTGNPVENLLQGQLFPASRGAKASLSISPSAWSTVKAMISRTGKP
jgi:hypothetical protein